MISDLRVKRMGLINCYVATALEVTTGCTVLAYGDSLIEAVKGLYVCSKKYFQNPLTV